MNLFSNLSKTWTNKPGVEIYNNLHKDDKDRTSAEVCCNRVELSWTCVRPTSSLNLSWGVWNFPWKQEFDLDRCQVYPVYLMEETITSLFSPIKLKFSFTPQLWMLAPNHNSKSGTCNFPTNPSSLLFMFHYIVTDILKYHSRSLPVWMTTDLMIWCFNKNPIVASQFFQLNI